jgi:magnesium chelatase family protein
MLARTYSFALDGLEMCRVTVEVDVRPGMPDFRVSGLADARVREARDRVRAAICNSGFEFPLQRIVANLAPADVPKGGSALDLALACALLAASGQLSPDRLQRAALFGELALDGALRGCTGTLAAAQGAAAAGFEQLVVAPESAREARLVAGLGVAAANSLQSAARIVAGGEGDPLPPATADPSPPAQPLDLADVQGQREAVRALVVAAAGGHNVLLCGPPGVGKTMLAQRLPSIMPPLSDKEAIEVARIHSIAGAGVPDRLDHVRPFRAPHHSVTAAGLIGGAGRGWVGEIVLANHGVLFLDELGEFAAPALEALREPLESGQVAIVRARHAATYPARFQLVAATNPCRCGYAGGGGRSRCGGRELARYRRRLSGPLLERIDLFPRVALEQEPGEQVRPLTSSARAREAVLRARERQAARFAREPIECNAQMTPTHLREHARLDERAQGMLLAARGHGRLSVRAQHRALRVARTVADLRASERVRAPHLRRALELRGREHLPGDEAG